MRDLFGTRLELRLGDPADSEIDRRAAANVPTGTPGRGLSRDKLHFLSALPRIDGKVGDDDLPDAARPTWSRRSAAAWPSTRRRGSGCCPGCCSVDELRQLADQPRPGHPDRDRRDPPGPGVPGLRGRQPHLVIFGDAECGKTNLLRLIAKTIVDRSPPRTRSWSSSTTGARCSARSASPHLIGYVPSLQVGRDDGPGHAGGVGQTAARAGRHAEQLRDRSWWAGPELFFLVDDYDLVAGSSSNPLQSLVDLLPQARDIGLHLVVARRSGGAARALYEPLLQRLRELDAPGLVMSGNRDEGALVGNVRPSQQPPGRGTLVRRRDGVSIVQTALFTEAG